MTTAAPAERALPASPTWLDRAVAAYPLIVAYVALLLLVAWQTTRHPTPWNFIDELKWTELSRGVADTGRPELRGAPASMGSLYTYLIAPVWWLGDTAAGYAAAKYVNAAVMTASIFPGYGLARLFAPRWPALAAGVLTASIPAVAYAGMLIPESLAYTWTTLVLWLVARALLRPTRATVAAAVVVLVLAPLVRSQLSVLLPAAGIAAAVVAVTSGRGRAVARGWSAWDWTGAGLLLIGAGIWANAFLTHHSYSWQVGTAYSGRMLEYGLWAAGAFAIGVGVVPVVVTLAWALSGWTRTREDRVLLGLALGSIACFGLYTAVKASYISTTFAIRVEERNLIYLSPVVFAVTARWLARGRARFLATAAAALAVWYLVDTTPYHMEEHFSVDAPGLAILSWLNRTWYWTPHDARALLIGIVALGVALLVGREVVARRRVDLGRWRTPAAGLVALTVVAIGAWSLAGEITASNASNSFARDFRGPLPNPPDFVDRITGGERALFIGQQLGNSNALWSLEFWNRAIDGVWSVDSSTPPPGPTVTPNVVNPRGVVDPQPHVKWVVAPNGVAVVGTEVAERSGLRVLRVAPPFRLEHAENGVTPDGWMSRHSWFAQYSSPGRQDGDAVVVVSRAAACGDVPPAPLTMRFGRVRIDRNDQPQLGRVFATRHVTVRSSPCDRDVTIRVPARPPFRVDVTSKTTFKPSKYDPRDLSVQVGYGFEPRKSR